MVVEGGSGRTAAGEMERAATKLNESLHVGEWVKRCAEKERREGGGGLHLCMAVVVSP